MKVRFSPAEPVRQVQLAGEQIPLGVQYLQIAVQAPAVA